MKNLQGFTKLTWKKTSDNRKKFVAYSQTSEKYEIIAYWDWLILILIDLT